MRSFGKCFKITRPRVHQFTSMGNSAVGLILNERKVIWLRNGSLGWD